MVFSRGAQKDIPIPTPRGEDPRHLDSSTNAIDKIRDTGVAGMKDLGIKVRFGRTKEWMLLSTRISFLDIYLLRFC